MASIDTGAARAGAAVAAIMALPVLTRLATALPGQVAASAVWICLATVALLFVATAWAMAQVVRKPLVARVVAAVFLIITAALFTEDVAGYVRDQLRAGLMAAGWLPLPRSLLVAGAAAFVAAATLLMRKRAWLRSTLHWSVDMVLLAALLLAAQATWRHVVQARTDRVDISPPAVARPDANRTRVVVVVFDELDHALLMERRGQLPRFDRLLRTGVWGTNVYPPSNYTHQSLPRMLLGRPLLSAEFDSEQVRVRESLDHRWHDISVDPNLLFRRATAAGRSVAVAGWHLPYCRLLGAAARCLDDARLDLPQSAVDALRWMWEKNPLADRVHRLLHDSPAAPLQTRLLHRFDAPSKRRMRHAGSSNEFLTTRAIEDIRSGRDLVFVHLPCPHLPALRSSVIGQERDLLEAYAGNLAVCDGLLGRLDDAMRAVSSPGVLIVTSDHWLRSLDCLQQRKPTCTAGARRRVPLLLSPHVPGASERQQPLVTDMIISNLQLASLVMNVLSMSQPTAEKLLRQLQKLEDHPTLIEPF